MSVIIKGLAKFIPEKGIDIFGKNQLLMTSLPYYCLIGILLMTYATIFIHPWFLIALIYSIIPLLDELFTRDYRNPTEEERKQLEKDDIYFKACLLLTIAADWFLFIEILRYMATYDFESEGLYKYLGVLTVYTNLNATQFTLAH